MSITAELHDGRKLEFPDGTDSAVIQATVKKVLGAPQILNRPPTVADIPTDGPIAAPKQAESPSLIDYARAPLDTSRTIAQNAIAGLLGHMQGGAEALGGRIVGRPSNPAAERERTDYLVQNFSRQPTNPATLKMLESLDVAAKSEPGRLIQALGPGGGIISEAGLVAPAATSAAQIPRVVAPVVRPVANAVSRVSGAAGGALDRGYGLVSGRTAAEAADTLKSTVAGEAGAQADTLAGQAAQAASGRTPEVKAAEAVASTRLKVADKVRTKAEQTIAQEKTALDALHNKSLPNEDIGALIQEKGTANLDALKGAREKAAITDLKDPAFAEARVRAANGDFLTNNPKSAPILEKARKQFLQQIEDMRLAPDEKAAMIKNVDALFGGEPMTLHQAEGMRRFFNEPLTRDPTKYAALKAHDMGEIGKTMTEAMNAYEPRVGKYIGEYRAGSEKIEKALGSNAGKAATDTIAVDEDVIRNQKPMQAHNYYMGGDEAGAKRMVELVGGKTPEITDAVKANLRAKLENLDAVAAQKMLDKNEGLLRVFPEVKPLAEGIVKAKVASERAGKLVPVASERANKSFDESLKLKQVTRESAAAPQKLADDIRIDLAKLDDAPQGEALSTARGIVDRMAKGKLIDEAKYQELLKQIRDTEATYGKTAKARTAIKYIIGSAIGAKIGLTVLGH